MNHPFSPERRRFLRFSALAGASLLLPGLNGCATVRPLPRPADTAWRQWPLERKVAQMLVLSFYGDTAPPDSPIAIAIRDVGIGGVVLYDNNIPLGVTNGNIITPPQVRTLTTELHAYAATPLFVAVDQEGGMVARLKEAYGFPPSVSARYLGTRNDPNLTRAEAEKTAATLREHGFNLNLAPVLDLDTNPDNPIIARKERSFSADPGVVAAHAAACVAGHHRQRVVTCLKHFPGHGSARDDSHLGLADVTKYWQEKELEPYRALIGQGLCDMVMTAHTFNTALDPDYPATLSRATIHGLLRQRLGFDGVVVSDDLSMGAIVRHYTYETAVERAVTAGVDMLVVANAKPYDPEIAEKSVTLIVKLVTSGRIARERIDEACARIVTLKERFLLG